MVEKAFQPARRKLSARDDLGRLMQDLQDSWTPPSPFTKGNFTSHTDELMKIWKEAGKDPGLALADPFLFPGWSTPPTPPPTPPGATPANGRQALYLGQRILQLMENVYLDLQLEESFDHPDNDGWEKVFRTWAASDLIKETYRRSKGSYGIRFRAFCERELGLPGD